MYNIFLLSEDSTEKKIARRQLAFKDINSNSWFTEVKSLLWKYDLNSYLKKQSNLVMFFLSGIKTSKS
jgi:hypothetical protein